MYFDTFAQSRECIQIRIIKYIFVRTYVCSVLVCFNCCCTHKGQIDSGLNNMRER